MEQFFGLTIDPLSLMGKVLVLMLAVLLGGLVGLERQFSGNAAGLRTHILVCVGATLMTLTAMELAHGTHNGIQDSPGRMLAQIISGIGFLGAGAILRNGTNVHGLTTAASIWVTAGIGITIGVGPHLGELGILATVIVLFTLFVLRRFELRIPRPRQVEVEVDSSQQSLTAVLTRLETLGASVHAILSDADGETGTAIRKTRIQVELPTNYDRTLFNSSLMEEKSVLAIRFD